MAKPDKMYRPEQAAKKLGVSVGTVYRWVRAKELPATKLPSRRLLIAKRDIKVMRRVRDGRTAHARNN